MNTRYRKITITFWPSPEEEVYLEKIVQHMNEEFAKDGKPQEYTIEDALSYYAHQGIREEQALHTRLERALTACTKEDDPRARMNKAAANASRILEEI